MKGGSPGVSYAPLVVFVSASGGVGKSTLSLVSSWLAASAGVSTALVEGDLQFGDMGYWLGLDGDVPNLSSGMACEPIHLVEGLSLYKAPAFPEVAEEVSDDVASLVAGIRRAYGLVIADTGQFWSGLTADLVLHASLVAVVADFRPASVMGAVRAMELCSRIGVASSRCVTVYNRYSGKARLSEREVKKALATERVLCVPEGRAIVDSLMSVGAVDELVGSGNPMVSGVDGMLCELLPRVGVIYGGAGVRGRRAVR